MAHAYQPNTRRILTSRDALDQLEETRAHKEYFADAQVTVVSILIAD